MNKAIAILQRIINGLGSLCAILLLLMILNVFYDVIMRYLFNNVSIGMQELEWHLFSTMFLLGIAYALNEDAHVRVDVFYEDFSTKTKALINIIGIVFFLIPFSLLVIHFADEFVYESFQLNERSGDPGGLPFRWLIKSVIPLAFVFLILSGICFVLKQIQVLRGEMKIQETDKGDMA